jgi:hypothetical protein
LILGINNNKNIKKANGNPSRVFFDTSVINFIIENVEEPIDKNVPNRETQKRKSDINTLRNFFVRVRKALWESTIIVVDRWPQ